MILQVLEENGRPISNEELFALLAIADHEKEILSYRLKAMLRDGQIMSDRRGRLCLVQRINLVRGKVQGHADGYGFFIPDDGSADMVLSPKEMRAVMHGDHILAYQSGFDKRNRPEAKIREVIAHANATIVGKFIIEYNVGFVIPDNTRLTQDISIPLEFSSGATHGQIVLVAIIAFPSKRTQPIGKVIQILGDPMAPGMETKVAMYAHGIPTSWSEDIVNAVKHIPNTVTADQCIGRVDLRALPFVTIDSEDAQDFDDAVYCRQKLNGNWQLFVAIADVSFYVPKDSPLDQEALLRGNSIYFPNQVIPMLPEALSNGICSLNPHVDRLCMVVELIISTDGKIKRSNFYRAVFHSHARLTYTQVAKWLADDTPEKSYEHVWPVITALNTIYKGLVTARKARGALDFDVLETHIDFDEQQKIQRIVPTTRNEAHKIIEECMLAANVAVALFLKKSKIAMLYRVHNAPEAEKMEALRKFLGEFGLQLGGGKKPHSKDFQKTLTLVAQRQEKNLLETVMLRSLKQAQYVESNDGHFGLSYAHYTHFTSPIRRYPDLLIHRAMAHILDQLPIDEFAYTNEDMARLGKHCSVTERRADEAVRQVVSWLKCEYMQDKLGQVFPGKISAVTGFGIFVELDDIYVEGLVHVTSLRSDYYVFDAAKHRLVGERSGQVYSLGDKIVVLVARVDLDDRKIDFEAVTNDNTTRI